MLHPRPKKMWQVFPMNFFCGSEKTNWGDFWGGEKISRHNLGITFEGGVENSILRNFIPTKSPQKFSFSKNHPKSALPKFLKKKPWIRTFSEAHTNFTMKDGKSEKPQYALFFTQQFDAKKLHNSQLAHLLGLKNYLVIIFWSARALKTETNFKFQAQIEAKLRLLKAT